MNLKANVKYPQAGISSSNGSGTPFQVTFPAQDAQTDSEEILRPAQIIEEYNNLAEPLSNTKALLDHVLDLIANNWFESFTQLGADSFYSPFKQMADAVYNLEQHAVDKHLQWSILRFLEHVMKQSPEQLADAGHAIDQLVERYGSLTNGLHHFTRGTRA